MTATAAPYRLGPFGHAADALVLRGHVLVDPGPATHPLAALRLEAPPLSGRAQRDGVQLRRSERGQRHETSGAGEGGHHKEKHVVEHRRRSAWAEGRRTSPSTSCTEPDSPSSPHCTKRRGRSRETLARSRHSSVPCSFVERTDGAQHREHVVPVPSIEGDRAALARFIDAGEASEAEIEYYEAFSDPDARRLNEEQRRRAGQYLRRLRRLTARRDGRN